MTENDSDSLIDSLDELHSLDELLAVETACSTPLSPRFASMLDKKKLSFPKASASSPNTKRKLDASSFSQDATGTCNKKQKKNRGQTKHQLAMAEMSRWVNLVARMQTELERTMTNKEIYQTQKSCPERDPTPDTMMGKERERFMERTLRQHRERRLQWLKEESNRLIQLSKERQCDIQWIVQRQSKDVCDPLDPEDDVRQNDKPNNSLRFTEADDGFVPEFMQWDFSYPRCTNNTLSLFLD